MFNVTILKGKDIIKYFAGIVLTITIVIISAKYFSISKKEKTETIKTNAKTEINLSFLSIENMEKTLGKTIPAITSIENQNKIEKVETSKTEILEKVLKTQISSIKEIEEIDHSEENDLEIDDEKTQTKEKQKVELATTSQAQTEVVTQNPIAESYNVVYGNVKIKNQTSYNLTEEVLNPNIIIDNKNILIFHTHTCESYTPTEQYPYDSGGNYRTTDLNLSVARVGTELENYLKEYKINVTHDITYHDYPAYTGSYTRSLQTVKNILANNPTDIIIDLHRDAIGSRSDYAPTVKIGEDYAAQIMFVIGTNEGGLEHPNWEQNLKFAVKVQQKAEEMYPGLFKPMMVTKSRYNQHTGKYANIIEVGATGNTLEQCLTSMKYFSAVMEEVLK